jgi:NADPH:quinone reductase-like Zn-dependent oxidoreductase
LADYVALPEDWLLRAPATLTPAEASTPPCAGLTAWFALIERGHLHAGQTVLVEGTGGVALFGIQIAKMHGVEVLVSGSADKLARAKDLGANHCIDRREENWVETVLRLTDDLGADHILELVGGPHLANAVQVAAVGGRIYQIGALQGFDVMAPAMPLMLKDVTIHGIATGHRHALEDLVNAVDLTGLKPVIDTSHPFDSLSAALDHLGGSAFGKIVLEIE